MKKSHIYIIRNILFYSFFILVSIACEDTKDNEFYYEKTNEIEFDSINAYISDFNINKDTIYIADKYSNCIWIYNISNDSINKYQFEGKGPGEFQQGPNNFAFSSSQKIAIVDGTLPKINIFRLGIHYERTIHFISAITEIEYTKANNLIISKPPMPTMFENNSLTILDNLGTEIHAMNPKNLSNRPLYDMFIAKENPKNKHIIVSFIYRNIIQEYSESFEFLREISYSPFPDEAKKTENIQMNPLNIEIPNEKIFRDMYCDSLGFIYILSGNGPSIKKQVILVYNSDMEHTRTIKLNQYISNFQIMDDLIIGSNKEKTKLAFFKSRME